MHYAIQLSCGRLERTYKFHRACRLGPGPGRVEAAQNRVDRQRCVRNARAVQPTLKNELRLDNMPLAPAVEGASRAIGVLRSFHA